MWFWVNFLKVTVYLSTNLEQKYVYYEYIYTDTNMIHNVWWYMILDTLHSHKSKKRQERLRRGDTAIPALGKGERTADRALGAIFVVCP